MVSLSVRRGFLSSSSVPPAAIAPTLFPQTVSSRGFLTRGRPCLPGSGPNVNSAGLSLSSVASACSDWSQVEDCASVCTCMYTVCRYVYHSLHSTYYCTVQRVITMYMVLGRLLTRTCWEQCMCGKGDASAKRPSGLALTAYCEIPTVYYVPTTICTVYCVYLSLRPSLRSRGSYPTTHRRHCIIRE